MAKNAQGEIIDGKIVKNTKLEKLLKKEVPAAVLIGAVSKIEWEDKMFIETWNSSKIPVRPTQSDRLSYTKYFLNWNTGGVGNLVEVDCSIRGLIVSMTYGWLVVWLFILRTKILFVISY